MRTIVVIVTVIEIKFQMRTNEYVRDSESN